MDESLNRGRLVLVITAADPAGVLRVADDGSGSPGLPLDLRQGVPVETQIRVAVRMIPELPEDLAAPSVRILDLMESAVTRGQDRPATLVLVRVEEAGWHAPSGWPTFPAILRSLPRGKTRVSWMKAMQILAGGLEQDSDALEVDEEVLARLRSLVEDEVPPDS